MQNDRINEIFKSRAIRFVRSKSDSTGTVEEHAVQVNSSSDFYRSLLDNHSGDKGIGGSGLEPTCCSVCGIAVLDSESHELSAAHQSSLDQSHEQPVIPLDLNTASAGYRYLEKYGWTRLHRTGLGAPGREGSRTPMKVVKKDGRTGIGEHKTPRDLLSTTINEPLATKAIKYHGNVVSNRRSAQLHYEQEQKRDRQIRNLLK